MHIKGRHISELTRMFNSVFGTELSENQIRAACHNRRLCSGLDCSFKKGHVPANSLRYIPNSSSTKFKKGQVPHNHMPVGSESEVDGYIRVKIAEPNRWFMKHVLLWQLENGKVPDGYKVIFADGNRHNFNIDNLVIVSSAELLYLNRHRLIYNNADLTKVSVNIAKVATKAYERQRELKKEE